MIENEKRKLINEMNDILISTSVELEKLEDIIEKIIIDKTTSDKEIKHLILMKVEIENFKNKFKIINKNIFNKKFNIVEIAKKNQNNLNDN